MDTIYLMFLVSLVLILTAVIWILSIYLLVVFPYRFGWDTGVWAVKKVFPSWPRISIDELGEDVADWLFVALVVVFGFTFGAVGFAVAITVTGLPVAESPHDPHYMFASIYDRPLEPGLVDIVSFVVFTIAVSFIAAFINGGLFLGRRNNEKQSTDSPASLQ